MKKYIHNLIAWKLKKLVKWLLISSHPLVIGITGSAGKSTTKEAVYEVLNTSLQYKGKVKKSVGNLNTDIGLPLAVLGFNSSPRFYEWPFVMLLSLFRVLIPQLNPLSRISILVLEYAADKPGDIKYLTEIIKPDIAIITVIGPAHLVNYQSINQIAEEKMQLALSLDKSGIALLNKQDPHLKQYVEKIKCEIKYFDASPHQTTMMIAKKIGEIFEINLKIVEKVLKNIKPMDHRLNLIKIDSFYILDDCYNANPLSTKMALEELSVKAKEVGATRKIAILGDMLELGQDSAKYHHEIGELAKKTADIIITIGEESKQIDNSHWFKDQYAAGPFLLNMITKGDIILVKASRKIGLEKLVDRLMSIKFH
ncbi:MAG: UDP-N-acetylmuramoyl-tripeptide-D-alanyl-D-alanine ligase [uncultured bacterium]|nr:MAG: UDP-N-acetylmuramoyl-tripeptide-D-alanyl-D-alanine ligase [uncultured bacterium]